MAFAAWTEAVASAVIIIINEMVPHVFLQLSLNGHNWEVVDDNNRKSI